MRPPRATHRPKMLSCRQVAREILTSNSYARLLEKSAEFLRANGHTEIVLIAPSRSAADDLVRSACGSTLFGIHRTTLTGLAAALAAPSIAERGLAPMSQLSREALAARVVFRLSSDGAIPYFHPVANTPGLSRAVARSIQELRLQRTDLADLAATGRPGADLARMLALHRAELARESLADYSDLLEHATEIARRGKHRLTGLPVLLLDVSADTARQRELLNAVCTHAPSILAVALASDSQALLALTGICPGAQTHDLDDPRPAESVGRIQRYLFAPTVPESPTRDSTIDFFSAAGESLECVEIARRIASLVRDGVALDRIAVLLRGHERYQPLLEEAMRRAGLGAWFSRGVARPDPAGRAFLALLTCAAERCSASRFAEYLSLGQVPPLDSTGAYDAQPLPPSDEILGSFFAATETQPAPPEPAPPESDDAPVIDGSLQSPAGWERLLVDASVIGGHDRWARRLRGLEQEFRLRLEDLDDANDSERAHLERQVARLKNLERFALPLIERLNALPAKATWGTWIEALSGLAKAALRKPESVLSVLDELQSMEEVGPAGLDEVIGILSDRLRFLRRDPPLRRYGQVFVGTIEEARARSFDAVFLPGLAEGLFPRKALEDAVLLDDYRRALPGLPMQDDRVSDERALLRIAAAAAKSRLIFSYPRMDVGQSRPRVPSFYALEIVRAAQGHFPNLREFEKIAALSAPSRLDWPAPRDPMQAIDDAEYDLASLGRTLSLKPGEARATGRYLIEANGEGSPLVRSLRMRAWRWRTKWSAFDGIFEPDSATRAVLANFRTAERSYSPSSLQHFSACPYRFLLHAVYQLRPREEAAAVEQMDPLTRGALFHRAQLRLFLDLRDQDLLPMKSAALHEILQTADRALDREAAALADRLAPAIPRVWRDEVEDLRTDLRGWIRQLATEDAGWKPVHFEFSFGLPRVPERDSASVEEPVTLDNGIHLRGAIDLIEQHETRGSLRITDHKTGKAPERIPQSVGGGSMLQPLLYALAAERLLAAPAEVSRLSYCTQRGDYKHIQIALSDDSRARVKRLFEIVDNHIERGFLAPSPQTGACRLCDYRPVCGPYEEQRARRKAADPIEELTELRGMP